MWNNTRWIFPHSTETKTHKMRTYMTAVCVLFTLNLFIVTNTHLFNFKFVNNFRIKHTHIASVDQCDAIAFYPDPDVEIMEAFHRITCTQHTHQYTHRMRRSFHDYLFMWKTKQIQPPCAWQTHMGWLTLKSLNILMKNIYEKKKWQSIDK